MKFSIWLILFWYTLEVVHAQSTAILKDKKDFFDISPSIEVYEDITTQLTIDEVQKKRFIVNKQKIVNFGVSKSVIWLRFTLQNQTPDNLFLEISEPVIDSITLYKTVNTAEPYSVLTRSGIYTPFLNRVFQTNFFLFDLNLPPQQTNTYYLRVQNSLPLVIPVKVSSLHTFFEYNHTNDLIQGMYFGLMLAVAIFNFYISYLFGSRTYVYYFLYVLFFTAFFSYQKGLAHEYLWPDAVWFNRYTSFFITGTFVFAILFVHGFLYVEYRLPVTRWIKWALLTPVIAGFILTLTPLRSEGITLLHGAALAITIYLFFLGIVIGYKGYKLGIFFTAIWSLLLISAAIFVLQLSNILPSNHITRNAMQIGSALEVILLSFAIAFQINKYRRENEAAQNEVIKHLKMNEQMRSRIARDLHDDIGSTLSSIAILSQVAQDRLQQRPESVKELIEKISSSSLKVQDAMSDIVWTTRPDKNSFGSITLRMQEFTAQVFETQEIEYSFHIDSTLVNFTFSPEYQYDFYLIFKEAVNNVAKYAKAQQVTISIQQRNEELILSVSDNGIGFDLQNIHKGNGLDNMQRRSRNLGGDLHIETYPAKGTTIKLIIPLSLPD
ncbi:sensor histidine kinase [Xanthocytophaga flava]|uniref:sensor histidine kinase n=1 Tax=Xanthocytophaga flava TaxID=3048013 RepID=UPI0028D3703B|nr:7TM diverse intracellular signaling domain-containing protein [Xanthocytophaga flavus]MDJ1467676.1 7TM diverse intracellular signaling domain-containing protein [Xanthocytophaga flavus]